MSSNEPPPQQQPPGRNLPQASSLSQLQQWQQQMSSMEQRYSQLTGQNYRWQEDSETAHGPGVPPLAQAAQSASGMQQMGNQLAERYGIGGRAPLVDAAGNFNRTPQSAEEGVKFQYIADALANYQAQQAQNRAEATQAAGIGLVQQRGRGSLALLQQGAYQSLAGTIERDKERINNMAPDFSAFIEMEMQNRAEEFQREVMRFQKKQSKYAMIGGIVGMVGGGLLGGVGGAGAGMQLGSAVGGGMSYI